MMKLGTLGPQNVMTPDALHHITVNRFGVIPKVNQTRLISSPKDSSVKRMLYLHDMQ